MNIAKSSADSNYDQLKIFSILNGPKFLTPLIQIPEPKEISTTPSNCELSATKFQMGLGGRMTDTPSPRASLILATTKEV